MTDNPAPLPTQTAVPSQTAFDAPVAAPVVKDEVAANAAETVEEEPYTIKCICNFSDDDGNTIYCETCDTWQHIDCFYPNNRDEAIREDFSHSCADCKPRPLDRQKAIERTLRLRNAAMVQPLPVDKKAKRPPSKSHKKKVKPADLQGVGQPETGKSGSPSDQPSSSKKPKSSHRSSHSVSSQPSKRSPSFGNPRPNHAHPPSPATTPPDLPDDFLIHHYSDGFYSLYNESDVPDTHNNAFANIAIPAALGQWLRDPETMKKEVGRTRDEVFRIDPPVADEKKPTLEVKDSTRSSDAGLTLRWRFVKSTTPIAKDVRLIELNGQIGFQKDYCADPDNLWTDLSSPLPFVFFHPILPLYIDTRKEGSLARYVRRSCKPNAQLDTYLSSGSEYHFWLVSDRYIAANEQITLPWDFRLEKSVHSRWLNLLGLNDDDVSSQDEPEMDPSEYNAISNWIDRILSEYGGCACDLENNCAFARFHRHYLYGKNRGRVAKKKSRKSRNHTISPTSTGQATNSRAPSEGHVDDGADNDTKNESSISRSKPSSRDRTPLPQGQFDQLGILTEPTDRDKRKVAMVEDSFRRMEQQQPPRKKKRVSDGTSTTSSKPKSRNGSAAPPGSYVDAGTSRSKSGSPASGQSPNLSNLPGPSTYKPTLSIGQSRQSSAAPRSAYCDAGVQTDPVQGEWFSQPARSHDCKRRILSLSKRLLNSRLRNIVGDEEARKQPSQAAQSAVDNAMDIDSTTADPKPFVPGGVVEPPSPMSQFSDTVMSDQPAEPAALVPNGIAALGPEKKTPDLRVQMPPIPAFDNTGLVTTPLSASGAAGQSPVSGTLPSPFAPPAVNGVAVNPSPAKKKLSLSDYTKSRMNKAAGKVAGGSALLKPGLASPEEIKVEVTFESQAVDKPHDPAVPSTAPTSNGH
ncbi:SET domain-containing protein 3 [Purpureocillium takamizusanense]|uniref:SET domain-containing protein 3 n=1 Tax=Purpureocillium takamizusanense TaxID=2060973 RepID=A0A9Q8QLG6_9HYPO|nr:SET domain-containing protein 3 [Purpureocillium takamizusanense]UNI21908.1 SET domain-containing protein 3 [Purpureocillium takamizusanense]